MSEKMPQMGLEQLPTRIETSPEHHRLKHDSKEHEPTQKEKVENLASLRKEVGQEAKQAGDVKLDQSSENKVQAAPPVNRELKSMMRIRTLNRVRKELPAPQRALSKIIHAKPVEAVRRRRRKTIARPIGLLGGGFAALAGSLTTFYMAKHYGFRYNLLPFIMLFVAGYVVATH